MRMGLRQGTAGISSTLDARPPFDRQRGRLSAAFGVLAIMLALAVALPSVASAAECTNTWTGPAESSWTTAGNWSAGHVPNESDVACIGSGKTVNITSGTQKVSVVQGEGALKIKKSTLELLSGSESSQIKTLTMEFEAVLTGAGTLKVTGSLSWTTESTMSGSGKTILQSGATGSITTGGGKARLKRAFVNEGSLSINKGLLWLYEGTTFENKGTVTVNLEEGKNPLGVAEGNPLFVNTGTLQKTEGKGTTHIKIDIENFGAINAETGMLEFDKVGQAITLGEGTSLKGNLVFSEAKVKASASFTSSSGNVTIEKSTLTLPKGITATFNGLIVKFNTEVLGEGTLAISGNFEWALESTMSGSGKTILQSGATGSITTGGGKAKLKERTFVNEGSLSINKGLLRFYEGAAFENKGTLTVNLEEGKNPLGSEEGKPLLTNTGTIQKTSGTGTSHIKIDIENFGAINAETGTLEFDKASQAITLGEGTSLKGNLVFSEVKAKAATSFTSSSGQLTIEKSTLTLPKGVTATFNNLIVKYNTEVLGEGTLAISGNLEWALESTMLGTGKTVLQSGATGSITTGGGKAKLKERTFVNEGQLSVNTGLLRLSEGATFENKGTLTTNKEEAATPGIATEAGKTEPLLINTGTIQKTAGTGTSHIKITIENFGAINAETGTLEFDEVGQAITLGAGTSFKGSVLFSEAKVKAGASFTSAAGKVTIEKSTLTLPKGVTATFNNLIVKYNTEVLGEGTLAISGNLEWALESTMLGTGKTVLQSGATGSITTGGGLARIEERTFVNEGSLSINKGLLRLSEGAVFENKGTVTVNLEEGKNPLGSEGKVQPTFINTGTLQKTEGKGSSHIKIDIENFGAINAETGTLEFDRSGQIVTLNTGTTLKGDVLLSEVTATAATSFYSPGGHFTIERTTLTVPKGITATFNNLIVKYGNEVLGEGTLAISGNLEWTLESTMAGTGITVIEPGAKGSITTGGGWARVKERIFVNEGDMTVDGGLLQLSEGAFLYNTGTLTTNEQAPSTAISTGSGVTQPIFANSGTLRKTAGTGHTRIAVDVLNNGTIDASTGTLDFYCCEKAVILESGTVLKGSINFEHDAVVAESFTSSSATVTIDHALFDILEGSSVTLDKFKMRFESLLAGGGTLNVSGEFHWDLESAMTGTGTTKLLSGSVNTVDLGATTATVDRSFINDGTLTMTQQSRLKIEKGERLQNRGTFRLNQEPEYGFIELLKGEGHFFNVGTFERTEGKTSARVATPFENLGVIKKQSSDIVIDNPIKVQSSEKFEKEACAGDPVDCATGNFTESQTDFAIGGRGVGLSLARTYSAQAAAEGSSPSSFGYGWSGSFSDHLAIEEEGAEVTLTKSDGSTVPFSRITGTTYASPARSQETLSGSPEAGYTLIEADQLQFHFSGVGRLESIVDRNGNETAFGYDEAGRLKAVTDPAGRQIKLAYNGGGQVESAEDPMGHVVKYGYEGGNLISVTMPGEEGPRWQFKYDASHRITTVTDGRSGKTVNEYDGSSRVISQTDPAGRTLAFEYESFHTRINNEATGAVTDEWFTSNNEPFSITHGYGTADATTATFSYNEAGQLVSQTDGNGHTTTYGYDASGNKTSEKDAAGETKWTYNATHDVISTTTPRGETTTIKRDASGNVESISRPGPEETTQTTSFAYDENGQLESLTDPLKRTWVYGYNAQGDRTSETDPLGDTQTFGYNKDSLLTSTVMPRGNVEGAEPAEYETAVERDPQGRPQVVTDPFGQTTEYAYDGNGNLKAKTDANGYATEYVYNADDEQTKVEKPNGAVLETGYDGAGEVTSQTDANEHTTTYVRNVLEEPVEVIDPLGRKTIEEFDAAGNLKAIIDPAERETSFAYDGADRLVEISYSDEATPDTEFEYNPDGNVIRMIDGTGESRFEYDQLGRLTESEDGHGDVVGYGYNLAEEMTGIAYPNGESISRAYDLAGRLESVTDWLGGTTTFSYGPDSNLEAIVFPKGTGNVDEYVYDRADRMSEATFTKEAETLASLAYGRDKLGQVEEEARSGLPGAEEVSYDYDENERLSKADAESFEYDPADNLLKGLGSTNAYDPASQLGTGTGVTYSYDKLGERIKSTPGSGPATSYKYDQAGNLVSVERPEEGEVSAIKESFAYDGTGLMASKTSGLTTSDLVWNSTSIPLLLDDGENSYIYGPAGLPVEQVSSEEQPTFLHHDQLGSTRLLTDAGGESSATFSYEAYGGIEGSTGTATTPLGFAGQYTDAETGLQYLRARLYDPATAQFITRDPLEMLTRTPYGYANANPSTYVDLNGLGACILGFIDCDESDDPCKSLASGPMLAACLIPEGATKTVSDATAGFGDGASFDLTKRIREALGQSESNDTCSGLYGFSSQFGALFRDFTLTVAGTPALRYLPVRVRPQVPRDLPPSYQPLPRDLDPIP